MVRTHDRIIAGALTFALTISPILSPFAVASENATEGESVASSTVVNVSDEGSDSSVASLLDGSANAEGELTTTAEQGSGETDTSASATTTTEQDVAASETAQGSSTEADIETSSDGALGTQSEEDALEASESTLTTQSDDTEDPDGTDADAASPVTLAVKAKQGTAWLDEQTIDGSGSVVMGSTTATRALRLINLNLSLEGLTGGISYRVFSNKSGWQSWVTSGTDCGLSNKTLGAVRIKLTGDVADAYSVYYRICTAANGWMDWTCDGELAGTAGLKEGALAMEVAIYEKDSSEAPTVGTSAYEDEGVSLRAHVQNGKWLSTVSGTSVTAKTGKSSKHINAIKINRPSSDLTGNIKYRVLMQDNKWTATKKNGALAGSTSKKSIIQGIRITLSGELKKNYDVWYRVYVDSYGWLEWASNWSIAGSRGYSKYISRIQVKFVDKGATAPSGNSGVGLSYVTSSTLKSAANVDYRVYENSKWKSASNGDTAGSTKKTAYVRGFAANLGMESVAGGIKYSTYVAGKGWSSWSTNDAVAGTLKANTAGLKVKLTGKAAKCYDVWYRLYIKGVGWLGWAKNGQAAGSTVKSYPILSCQVQLLPKDSKAPGSTEYMVDKVKCKMMNKAQKYSSSSKWLIMIDDTHCRLGLFKGKKGNWELYRYWVCSTGANGATFPGTFKVWRKAYVSGCEYYLSYAVGSGAIHSILYYPGTWTVMDPTLGKHVSHGCVRLATANAKFIYTTIPLGTTTVVYR